MGMMDVKTFLSQTRANEPTIKQSVERWLTRQVGYRSPRNDVRRRFNAYFSEGIVDEIQAEATRLGLTFSQVVQRAWDMARETIECYPDKDNQPGVLRHLRKRGYEKRTEGD